MWISAKNFSLAIYVIISCITGLSARNENFIIGGTPSNIEETPWQIAFFKNGKTPTCGGSIISEKYVITAGHCVSSYQPRISKFSVVYGTKEPTKLNGSGIRVKVKNVYRHPKYDSSTSRPNYDVAILELERPVKFSSTARPVSLSREEPESGKKAIISGWGITDNTFSSKILLKAAVKIIDRKKCAKNYGPGRDIITRGMICAASKGIDACQGDSGGPITVDNILVGVVSWGYGCANPQFPGVYTNIALYSDFISKASNNTVQWRSLPLSLRPTL